MLATVHVRARGRSGRVADLLADGAQPARVVIEAHEHRLGEQRLHTGEQVAGREAAPLRPATCSAICSAAAISAALEADIVARRT